MIDRKLVGIAASENQDSTRGRVRLLKCPLCTKEMTKMDSANNNSASGTQEAVYYCERHGVMNKPTDLKEKADEIAKRV